MKPLKNRLYRPIDFRNAPSSRIALTCLAAFIVQYSSSASAADITWADSAGNTTWTSNNAINTATASTSWVGGVAPTNNIATDNAIFTSVSNAQPALTVQTRITGVDFQMADGGLAMTGGGGNGNLFQLGTGGIDSTLQTSGTNTITNARILLNAGSTWSLFSSTDTASTSTFTFNSTVDLANNLTVIGQRNSAAGNVGVINFERAITGTANLTINSSNTNNTVNLNGINTYAGVTNVNGGVVNVQNNQSAATGGWNIQTPNTAGVLATVNIVSGSTIAVASANKIQIGAVANSGSHPASTLNVAGTVDNDGALQMERASNLNLNNGAVWDQAGNLTLTARGGASATLAVNAGAQMTYTGSNTVKLNSAGTSGGSGLLNINGTGRFTTAAGFENTNSNNTGSGISRIRLTGGGTLRLSADVANLTTQTQFDLSTGGGVIDTNGFSTTLSGVTTAGSTSTTTGITGAGTLTKTGAGTLTLTGVNTYTGATSVASGTLLVNGSISTSSLTTVDSGATIGGSGTIGALTVSNGAFINPGNSTGILNTGNYTQLGLYTAEINGLTAGSQHDQINVGGTVDITGGSLSTIFTGSYSLNDIVFILTNNLSDAVTGTFTGLSQGDTVTSYGGFDWRISYVADSGTNSFTGGNDIALMAIPEPSSAFLGALSIALVFLRRRRA
jgi:autotransporter-associated beta strand protein